MYICMGDLKNGVVTSNSQYTYSPWNQSLYLGGGGIDFRTVRKCCKGRAIPCKLVWFRYSSVVGCGDVRFPRCSLKGNIMSALSLTSLAQACGASVGNMNKALASAEAFKTEANNNILALHKAKAKIGTYKKDGTGCGLATAFVDGCMASGLTQSTAQKTYLPTFKKAVESGKPVTDWNLQRAKKAGGTSNAAKGKKEFADKLATVYRDADFEGFMDDLQTSYENAEFDTLHEGIKSYLEASGIKLK